VRHLRDHRIEESSQLATRNISDFEETGIKLINPWKPG